MLVLSRKVGERIHVGENITIEIRRIAGNRVTLALDAPRNVRILRGELERAAREFETPTPLNGCSTGSSINGATAQAENEQPTYAVVSTRVNVVRDLPAQGIGRDYAI